MGLSLLGPELYPVDPDELDLSRAGAPPGGGHPLGTDESGRDVLSLLLAGGRVSLAVGFAAVACAALVGLTLGSLAGLGGRRIASHAGSPPHGARASRPGRVIIFRHSPRFTGEGSGPYDPHVEEPVHLGHPPHLQ